MDLIDLKPIPPDLMLKAGGHRSFDQGACVMEVVSYVAGEPWTDHPSCACPVITAFAQRINDRMPTDAMRTELLAPLIPLIVGTRSTPAVESKRRWLAVDFAVREALPHALCSAASFASCKDPALLLAHAMRLQALPEVTEGNSATAREACLEARAAAAAYAAYAAAYAAYAAAAAAAAAYAAYAAAADAADAAAAAAAYAAAAAAAADAAAARRECFALAAGLIKRMCEVTE